MNRGAELARCRAAARLDEEDCLVWFGVGRGTLERIEAGEVEPSDELAQRIDRFLQFAGGQVTLSGSPATPGPAFTHGADPTGGGAAATGPAANFGGPR